MIINDLVDKLARLAIAGGRHPVKGTLTKHIVEMVGNDKQVTVQVAVGQASFYDAVASQFICKGWDSIEKLYYAGEEIPAENYHFHSGGPADSPDAFFPTDIPHPKASYYSARLPQGFVDEDIPDQMVGIFKTGKFPNYDGAGVETDDGSYSPSPARFIADLRKRARRSPLHVNWPSWVDYRDYCAELIDWDDGALTPHYITLAASVGGSLAPGTYWVRVATKKGADISSASKDRANDGVTTASVVISGSSLQFTVTWTSQEERGATGYRVYIGTSEGGENKFFDVASGATNSLLVSSLIGASIGTPPEIATGSLLRQVPRFESHLFFPPPFELSAGMDRIAQITCMDWHYSGGKLVFLTPEIREPIFTLNMAELNSFKTYRTDRRQKYNQIIVNYRDLDSPYLEQADPPAIINRPLLQAKEGIRQFEINGGCMLRSQAERVGNYWARRLIDSDQMMECVGSPRTYSLLPGDVVNLTHDVPGWEEGVEFYLEEKEEAEDTRAGYPLKARIYGEWYSDTDQEPLPRPLPAPNPSPFLAPPVVADVTLEEDAIILTNGMPYTIIRGAVQFAPFVGHQRGRVWVSPPEGGGYRATNILLIPEPSTLQSAFEMPAVSIGEYALKVVTESEFGVSLAFGSHPEFTIDVTGELVRPLQMSDALITNDAYGDWFGQAVGHSRPGEEPAEYVMEIWADDTFDADPDNLIRTIPMGTATAFTATLIRPHTFTITDD